MDDSCSKIITTEKTIVLIIKNDIRNLLEQEAVEIRIKAVDSRAPQRVLI